MVGSRDSDRGSPLLENGGEARLCNFGLGFYGAILDLQEELRERRHDDAIPDTWLIGEHPLVITEGVRSGADELLLGPPASGETPRFKVDRGGMTTLHSPGQLILYPIVKVRGGSLAAGRLARALVRGMRSWIQSEFSVDAESRRGQPGLYVEGRKLMSIGISVRRGVSMHGVALNMCNDLSHWSAIVPCGDPALEQVSLSDLLGRRVEPADQIESIRSWLRDDWGYRDVRVEDATVRLSRRSGI